MFQSSFGFLLKTFDIPEGSSLAKVNMANLIPFSDFRLLVTFFVQMIVGLSLLGTFVRGCSLDWKFTVCEELLHTPQQ